MISACITTDWAPRSVVPNTPAKCLVFDDEINIGHSNCKCNFLFYYFALTLRYLQEMSRFRKTTIQYKPSVAPRWLIWRTVPSAINIATSTLENNGDINSDGY